MKTNLDFCHHCSVSITLQSAPLCDEEGGTLKDDESCHLHIKGRRGEDRLNLNWRRPPFSLPIDLVLQCPWLAHFKLILVDGLRKNKKNKRNRWGQPLVPSTLPYSWVALSLAMSAPSIQNSCPTFVSQTFYVPETAGQRVPTSANMFNSSPVRQKQIKNPRDGFPDLKFLIKTSSARHPPCDAFQMIAYSVALRWWETLSAIYPKEEEKKLFVADFVHWSHFFTESVWRGILI